MQGVREIFRDASLVYAPCLRVVKFSLLSGDSPVLSFLTGAARKTLKSRALLNMQRMLQRSNALILLFFFITGLTGLAYELAWIRLLILAFGSTQFAITTVLVVFMAGLGLGSLFFGRVADRFPYTLRLYAYIEIALGIYCALSPSIFSAVRDFYITRAGVGPVAAIAGGMGGVGGAGGVGVTAGFEFLQFALSFLSLIIPTTLMGGTLPVLVKYLASSSGRVGFHTAIPYAVNTIGAVAGSVLTGVFAMYVLGVKTTIYTAGAVDVAVGALVYLIYRGERARQEFLKLPGGVRPRELSTREKRMNLLVVSAFALSGFASLAYEVLWTRVFSLILGSSVYAFTVMLSTFLFGIGFGSLFFAPVADKVRRPVLLFAVLEAVIGFFALVSIFVYRDIPFVFYGIKESLSGSFWLFLLVQFLLCSAIMIIPTLSMGAIFPLVGRIYTRGVKSIGKNIGDIYFFNTAGSILGSFLAGFALIPIIGAQNGVILVSFVNVAIAAAIILSSEIAGRFRAASATAFFAAFVVITLSLPPWEKTVMTLGLYVNPYGRERLEGVRKGAPADNLLFYKEGINAVITVREEKKPDGLNLSYQANGKQEAVAVNGRPAESWALLGHIPLMLHQGSPEDALLVGLGSGITLGAMELYPLRSIDVVEIEEAVIEAASFFKEPNYDALGDPRIRIHVTDGRGFLFTKKSKYDVIVSAVSDPWISGVANLFTREYFEELKNKLNDDGVASLWFQNYRITPPELKIGLNTFASVFPHVSVWFHYTDTLDLIVIGSKKPHFLRMDRLSALFKDPRVKMGLGDIGLNSPLDIFDLYLIGDKDLRAYMGETVLNTDERNVFEHTLPRRLYMDPSTGIRMVEELLSNSKDFVPPNDVPKGERGRFYLALARSYNRYNFRLGQAYELTGMALAINPSDKEALRLREALRKELNY